MAQTTFDEDDLFEEATQEMQAEVDDALARARDAVPDTDIVLTSDEDDLDAILNALSSTLDTEEIETALEDAQKAFVLGQRADAFDNEYITETQAAIETLTETVDTLHAIDAAATDLNEALTRFETIDTRPQGDTGTADTTPSDDESPAQSDSQGALTETTSE
ncbi:DUF5790 family protein [Halobacterium salinarum]|uniref:DUF5790 family protein n=1 Tax=Halobacterium salinarum TaxID=2242 RepID=UPI00255301C8|nr:DUF5790 family protein [Halobacterium salinarum]MDL0118150.1 DUF5790 family protein [Halobacterium salinarum]MDL0122719.1 DUF5790 family protein [Halobacterium salinarum]